MSYISRSGEYTRDERGGEWFQEFLRLMNGQPSTAAEIIEKKDSVEDVIANYREQSGLNLITNPTMEKTASKKISKRAEGLGPIAPMKLRKMENPDDILKDYDDSDVIIQQKIDGFKTQAIKDKSGAVKLYTRRGEGFEANVPDLASELEDKMDSGDFWLGELAYLKNGKQSISDVQTVVGSNPEKAQEKLKEKGELVFYVYDLLWDAGTNITKNSYEERYNKLKKKLGKSKLIKIVDNYPYSDKDKAINDALKAGGEGIVLKPKKSEYKYAAKGSNEPVGEWAKHKPAGKKANTDEVILKEYSKGKEKLIFPMYQYKASELFEVGQLSGMSKEDEAKIKKAIDSGKQVVVEITFQERMPSGKFRHAGWSRFRPDKPAKEVKYSKASFISVRHAQKQSIVELIESRPDIKEAIISMCRHAGGHKNHYSIINFLRQKLGEELVLYSDDELHKYIDECNEQFKKDLPSDKVEVGLVGLQDVKEYEDNVADYISHGEN